MGKPCQIVYRYNGNEANDEGIDDPTGKEFIPLKDQVVRRKGQLWKVVMVTKKTTVGDPKAIPIHVIAVTDKF
jgi:hypothetical protein